MADREPTGDCSAHYVVRECSINQQLLIAHQPIREPFLDHFHQIVRVTRGCQAPFVHVLLKAVEGFRDLKVCLRGFFVQRLEEAVVIQERVLGFAEQGGGRALPLVRHTQLSLALQVFVVGRCAAVHLGNGLLVMADGDRYSGSYPVLVYFVGVEPDVLDEHGEIIVQVRKAPGSDLILFFLSMGQQGIVRNFGGNEVPVFDFGTSENAQKAGLVVLQLLEVFCDLVLLLLIELFALIVRVWAIALERKPGMLGKPLDAKIARRCRNVLVSSSAEFCLQDELKRRLPGRSVERPQWCDNQSSPALSRVSISPFPRERMSTSDIA